MYSELPCSRQLRVRCPLFWFIKPSVHFFLLFAMKSSTSLRQITSLILLFAAPLAFGQSQPNNNPNGQPNNPQNQPGANRAPAKPSATQSPNPIGPSQPSPIAGNPLPSKSPNAKPPVNPYARLAPTTPSPIGPNQPSPIAGNPLPPEATSQPNGVSTSATTIIVQAPNQAVNPWLFGSPQPSPIAGTPLPPGATSTPVTPPTLPAPAYYPPSYEQTTVDQTTYDQTSGTLLYSE